MEIKIGKPARQCFGTGRDFQHEEPIYSLARRGEEGLVREDYSESAWQQVSREGVYCTWRARYFDAAQAELDQAKPASPLRTLFFSAAEAEDRASGALAFIAAQLLRRQKQFKLVKEAESTNEEGAITLYADRLSNRLIEVHDAAFTYAELEAARNTLLEHLQAAEATEEAPAAAEQEPDTSATDADEAPSGAVAESGHAAS